MTIQAIKILEWWKKLTWIDITIAMSVYLLHNRRRVEFGIKRLNPVQLPNTGFLHSATTIFILSKVRSYVENRADCITDDRDS